jgi:probable HAF family extracellular repeat protein
MIHRIQSRILFPALATAALFCGGLPSCGEADCLETKTCIETPPSTGGSNSFGGRGAAAGGLTFAVGPSKGEGGDGGAAPTGSGGEAGSDSGEACSDEGERQCAAAADATILECSGGVWVVAETCARGELCDSIEADCATIAPGCERLAPGGAFCEDNVLVVCGSDLVTVEHQACEGRCASGACVDDGSGGAPSGSGGSSNPNGGSSGAGGDGCEENPCQNGGECLDHVDGYVCKCALGFDGPTCGIDIDECGSGPCQNGGSCVDQPGGYKCDCPTTWTGPTCETDVNECTAPGACPSGQTCRNFPGTFGCPCPPGYTGTDCELRTFEWLTPVSEDWTYCSAFDVSYDGKVVVGRCRVGEGERAFRWTAAEGMQSLGTLGDSSAAYGVSGDGKVIVGSYTIADLDHSFRWTASNGMTAFEGLAGEISSSAAATNQDGSVVVGKAEMSNGKELPYRWTASSKSSLGYSGDSRTVAESVSADGATVVGWGADLGPWKWTSADGMVQLPGPHSSPRGISPDTTHIVGSASSNAGYYALVWQGSTITEIPGLDSQDGQISNNGVVAGEDYIWSAQTGLRLSADALLASGADSGGKAEFAYNVNADGTVLVGGGRGTVGAWIARLPNGLK